jgi:hypothetical protein
MSFQQAERVTRVGTQFTTRVPTGPRGCCGHRSVTQSGTGVTRTRQLINGSFAADPEGGKGTCTHGNT